MSLKNRLRWLGFGGIMMVMGMLMTTMFNANLMDAEAGGKNLRFDMVPSSAAIKNCLPYASAKVTIQDLNGTQKMTIRVKGLPRNTDYDFFVTQVPHAKFGISWYQADLHVDDEGEGSQVVRGIFNRETFSVSPDVITTLGREDQPQTGAKFNAVNQYHLGLWFNDPQVPFKLGCEPGATAPVVTPFNGEQHAGIQVLNTSNFDDNNGPLKQLIP
jgi:hypothetical protein